MLEMRDWILRHEFLEEAFAGMGLAAISENLKLSVPTLFSPHQQKKLSLMKFI
jgi:hypothetical protein